jgi:uncharacterized protein (TIGR02466 family)
MGLFPTPILHAPGAIEPARLTRLRERLLADIDQTNAKSAELSHTRILQPGADAELAALADVLAPRINEMGELLFGERLHWSIKEMWLNVLRTGGQQALHTHANSFISGVVYLTGCHPDASLVFVKGMGQPGFVFKNTHRETASNPFNSDKWMMPAIAPGDVVLFPSYLLHEVPRNPGETRISLAFNAIPEHLDAWGYRVGFTA